jgi:hypothetical protein
MHTKTLGLVGAIGATTLLTAAVASASMMHPQLGANLSGMGDHGTANIQIANGGICWKLHLPMASDATRVSIHSGSGGAMLLEFGMSYKPSGCEKSPAMTLQHLETKPGQYSVWVDTKGHPGELRGRLFAGHAHMM